MTPNTPNLNVNLTAAGIKAPVDKLDMTLYMLSSISGITARYVTQEPAEGETVPRKAVHVIIDNTTLSLFDGSAVNQDANKALIKSMLYGFQELVKAIKEDIITGFSIMPEESKLQCPESHTRTHNIGELLAGICSGKITLE